jgi:hypothetical protein
MNDLRAFATEVTAAAARVEVNARDAYLITRVKTDWLRNPFYDKKSYQEWKASGKPAGAADGTVAKAAFHYMGYLETGEKKVAIINEIEYVAGDRLEKSDYILKRIEATSIVVANRTDGATLVIPLQEE